MFFYLCKVLFSGFLQFNGNFVDAQNNSEYRDWAPLRWPNTVFKSLYLILHNFKTIYALAPIFCKSQD